MTKKDKLTLPGRNMVGILALIITIILAVPLAAGWPWNAADYAVAALLLAATGLAFAFVAGRLRSTRQQLVAGAILLVGLMLVWAELAVGISDIFSI